MRCSVPKNYIVSQSMLAQVYTLKDWLLSAYSIYFLLRKNHQSMLIGELDAQ